MTPVRRAQPSARTRLGAETCLVMAALGFLVQVALVLTSPIPRLARQPEMVV